MLDVNQNINIRKTWLGGFLLDSPSPYILFNTIPPCPSQTGEGTAVKGKYIHSVRVSLELLVNFLTFPSSSSSSSVSLPRSEG